MHIKIEQWNSDKRLSEVMNVLWFEDQNKSENGSSILSRINENPLLYNSYRDLIESQSWSGLLSVPIDDLI